jgi:hypothetical protein
MLKRDCGLRDCGRGGWLSIQSKVIGERLLRSGRADLRREQAGLRGSQTFSCSELMPLARRRSRPAEVWAGRLRARAARSQSRVCRWGGRCEIRRPEGGSIARAFTDSRIWD